MTGKAAGAGRAKGHARWASLDPRARRTRRLDLLAGVFAGATIALLEMGGAIAKRGFNATDAQVAFLTSGQSVGLLLSFFVAHLAARGRKMPLVVFPELARSLCLGFTFFLKSGQAFAFVSLHAAAQMFQSVAIPARITVYRLNYPSRLRGSIVGANRQIHLVVATVAALLLSAALEWSLGFRQLVAMLGPSPLEPPEMLRLLLPVFAALGVIGTLVFRAIDVAEPDSPPGTADRSLRDTLGSFLTVWREDRDFRRYQMFFFVFGFANITTIPLTQIHAVDVLDANYFDLAFINVVLVQGLMAVSMGFWGKLVDRYPPAKLRGILNIIFGLDLLVLAVAPTIGWVYWGRVCRGVALGGGALVWMLGSLYYARSRELAPIYLGLHTVLTGARWLVAPFVGVWLKGVCGGDARWVFFGAFVTITVTGVLMIRQSAREQPRHSHMEPPMPAPRTPGA